MLSSKKPLQRTAVLTGLLLLLFAVTFFFPELFAPTFSHIEKSFTGIHLLCEMASIFISMSIALYGWVSFRHTMQEAAAILSSFFLAVALFDLLHLITFAGMPYFFGEPSLYHSTWFWQAARLTEGVVLLLGALTLNRSIVLPQRSLYALSAAFVAAVTIVVFSDTFSLPPLLFEARPNGLKVAMETLVALLHIAVVGVLVYQWKVRSADVPGEYYVASAAIILGSVYFMNYDDVADFTSLMGHLFKVIGYLAIMRIIFFQNIEEPFRKIRLLHERNRGILNTVDIGMIETDASGVIRFMNIPARQILNSSNEQAAGKSIYTFNPKTENVHDFSLMNRWNGETFPAEVERFPLMEKGRVTGYVFTLHDLTDAIRQEKLEKEKQQIDFEVKTAVSVQNSLLHSNKDEEREDIGGISIPYRDLNGDFFDITSRRGYTLFSVADVSGKGIPAAIQMSMIMYAMEQVNPLVEEPHHILSSLNRFVARYSSDSNFITMFLCFYNELTGELAYCSGGHEPALLYRAATGEFEELQTKGAGLGFIETAQYATSRTYLDEGDLVILYTDGISEDRGRDEVDSPDLLKEAVRQSDRSLPAHAIADSLFDYVHRHKIARPSDDQTIVVLKKTAR